MGLCRASVSDAETRRFTERSGGDASDTDGQPAGASKRERASQTPYKLSQRLIEVLDQVVRVFEADGQAQ